MIVNKKEFLTLLKKLKIGISTRGYIQSSDCYIFTKEGLTTFNDDICAHTFFDYRGPCEKVGVPHKELFDLVSRITTDEFDMEFTEEELHISTKRIHSKIKLEKNPSIPIEQVLSSGIDINFLYSFKENEDLTDGIKACVETVSNDDLEVVLGCVHFHKNGIESTNKFEITRIKKNLNIFPDDDEYGILIPGNFVKDICSFTIEQLALTQDGTWLWMMDEDGFTVYCRSVRASYLDVDRIFKKTDRTENTEITLPETILEVLERILVFSKEEKKIHERVSFEISNGSLTVNSYNQRGNITEKVRIRYDGPPFSFAANPHSLYRLLKYSNKVKVFDSVLYIKTETGIETMICTVNHETNEE